MKKRIFIEPCDLEEDDFICGFKAKDLIVFATAAREAGVKSEDLASFSRDTKKAYEFVIRESEKSMEKIYQE